MSVSGSPDDESTTSPDDATDPTTVDTGETQSISLSKTPEPTSAAESEPTRTAERVNTVDLTKSEAVDPAYASTQVAQTPDVGQYSTTGIAPSGPQFAPTQVRPTGGFAAQPPSMPYPHMQTGPVPVVGAAQFGGPPPNYPGYPGPGFAGPGYPPPPGPRSRNVGRIALLGVIVVCVIALVVGGAVWWTTRGSDAGSAPLAGQLTKEFPTAPSGTKWTYGIGSATAFVSPDTYRSMYMSLGAIHDDSTLVTMAQNNSTSARTVVGVTASGGHWEYNAGMKGCANAIVKHRVACYGDSTIVVLDATNGQVTQSFPVQGSIGALAFDGDNVFARANAATLTITKYSVTGGIAWTKSYAQAPNVPPSSGDSATFDATSSFVVSVVMSNIVVASTTDGAEVVNRGGSTETSSLADGSLVLQSGQFDGNTTTSGPVVVLRPSGSVVELTGEHGLAADVSSSHFSDSVFVDGKPTVVANRTTTWATAPSANPQSIPLATDSAVVVAADSKLTAVDPASGTTRWSTDAVVPYSTQSAVTDGKRVIFAKSDGSLSATDLTTGQATWSLSSATVGAHGSDYDKTAYVYTLGDTLVTLTGTQITGFAPTGANASAPGAAATKKSGGDSYVTKCGAPPTFTPEQFTTATGGLAIRMKVTATCPGGDVLSGAQTRVTVKDGGSLVASGYFDFSTTPLVLPKTDGGSSGASRGVELTFPPGSFYRLPDTLGSSSSSGTSSASGNTYLVECDRGSETTTQAPEPDTSAGVAASATGPAPAPGVDASTSVDDALRRQANADRSFIMTNLNNRWVAQLSSKRQGLVADGKTWTNADILNEFLALRLRFSDVRLLWSDEWPVFSYKGWWVTVAAATFPGPDAANSWCPQQGFDPDHCFAKLISTTAGPENSTRYWK